MFSNYINWKKNNFDDHLKVLWIILIKIIPTMNNNTNSEMILKSNYKAGKMRKQRNKKLLSKKKEENNE